MTDNFIEEFKNSETWKKYEEQERAKEKYLKSGPNVVHFEYLGPLFTDQDISEFENKLEDVGLELSRFDRNGTMYASLDNYQLVVYLVIAQPLIGQLIQGVATNAIWDIIKYILLSSWRKLKNQTYTRATSQQSKKKEISFGLKVKLDKNTSFNIKLDGDIEESVIESSLDKVLNFIGEQKLNESFKHADLVFLDKETNKWKKVDVEKEIRKMAANSRLKRKK